MDIDPAGPDPNTSSPSMITSTRLKRLAMAILNTPQTTSTSDTAHAVLASTHNARARVSTKPRTKCMYVRRARSATPTQAAHAAVASGSDRENTRDKDPQLAHSHTDHDASYARPRSGRHTMETSCRAHAAEVLPSRCTDVGASGPRCKHAATASGKRCGRRCHGAHGRRGDAAHGHG